MKFSLFMIPTTAQSTNTKEVLLISHGNDSHFVNSLTIDKQEFNIERILDTESLPNLTLYV
jgi:hypothetical protein